MQPVIVSMARTPIGSFGGSLKPFSSVELGTIAVKAALSRASIGGDAIDEIIFGCVGQYGRNAFISRLVGLAAGIQQEAPALTVNRMCASGLQAVTTAAEQILLGNADTVVAGGAESMSNYPYLLRDARWGMRMGVASLAMEDSLTTALCEPTTGETTHIAITAENIAAKYGITREELDAYALQSQERAKAAIDAGLFAEEIIPVEIQSRRETTVFDTDEHPRPTTLEKLARLKPFARKDGVVTAGNAAGINDGGAALVLMHPDKAKAMGLQPVASVVASSAAGVDPQFMGMGPVASTQKLLQKTGIALSDIGMVELNEAFASQSIACIRELGLDPAIVNVNGSGISLGHPIGATGAVIAIKLLAEMKRRQVRYGLATLCIGGGQGMSVLFENASAAGGGSHA